MDYAFPILLSENTAIVDVARTMAGRRVDAILVTDAEGRGELKGIVTDKDLAFRCVAEVRMS
jgi:CBS domain-containing protein